MANFFPATVYTYLPSKITPGQVVWLSFLDKRRIKTYKTRVKEYVAKSFIEKNEYGSPINKDWRTILSGIADSLIETAIKNESFSLSFIPDELKERITDFGLAANIMSNNFVEMRLSHPDLDHFGADFRVKVRVDFLISLLSHARNMRDGEILGNIQLNMATPVYRVFAFDLIYPSLCEAEIQADVEVGKIMEFKRRTSHWNPGHSYIVSYYDKYLYLGDIEGAWITSRYEMKVNFITSQNLFSYWTILSHRPEKLRLCLRLMPENQDLIGRFTTTTDLLEYVLTTRPSWLVTIASDYLGWEWKDIYTMPETVELQKQTDEIILEQANTQGEDFNDGILSILSKNKWMEIKNQPVAYQLLSRAIDNMVRTYNSQVKQNYYRSKGLTAVGKTSTVGQIKDALEKTGKFRSKMLLLGYEESEIDAFITKYIMPTL